MADVATRVTWHAERPGCDVALRPRGSAWVARAGGAQGAAKWQGGHTATWASVWGATCRFANKEE